MKQTHSFESFVILLTVIIEPIPKISPFHKPNHRKNSIVRIRKDRKNSFIKIILKVSDGEGQVFESIFCMPSINVNYAWYCSIDFIDYAQEVFVIR